MDDRAPLSVGAAVAAFALFMLVMGPWWARQVAEFGSISPTSSTGVALWIRDISEWNSITVDPTPAYFFGQGWGPIIASRLQGLVDAEPPLKHMLIATHHWRFVMPFEAARLMVK